MTRAAVVKDDDARLDRRQNRRQASPSRRLNVPESRQVQPQIRAAKLQHLPTMEWSIQNHNVPFICIPATIQDLRFCNDPLIV
jgi:hypothetical protein